MAGIGRTFAEDVIEHALTGTPPGILANATSGGGGTLDTVVHICLHTASPIDASGVYTNAACVTKGSDSSEYFPYPMELPTPTSTWTFSNQGTGHRARNTAAIIWTQAADGAGVATAPAGNNGDIVTHWSMHIYDHSIASATAPSLVDSNFALYGTFTAPATINTGDTTQIAADAQTIDLT